MDDQQLGALLRAVRRRRGLRQSDVAAAVGVSQGLISLVERGDGDRLSLATTRRIGAALNVRIDLSARWRGGDAGRLLSRRHSLLADSFVRFMAAHPGWESHPEASFSVYGERGSIDHLAWHAGRAHLLVVELKTEFVDVNETLATLDRKVRLAPVVGSERGWRPRLVSVWLVVSDTSTNRRHARQHAALFGTRFRLDGRSLEAFLGEPRTATTGLAFWSDTNRVSAGSTARRTEGVGTGMRRLRGADSTQIERVASMNGRDSAPSGREGAAKPPHNRSRTTRVAM